MQVIRDLDGCPRPEAGSAVTIGAYDGVHRGHRAVIAEVRRVAAERGLQSAVLTFDRHPAMVVRPESAPLLLTDLDQKLELLAGTGVDHALVVHFDEARSKEPAEEFVTEVLVGCLRARTVVVGEDFHFGHQRRGNVALLAEMGAAHGFDVTGLDLVGVDGDPADAPEQVSSTAIRRALRSGDLDRATHLLGRPHEVRGVVAHGDERGRELGFPTANVSVPGDILLPADGIYAGWYERPDGAVLPAALSLGRRPTFYDDAHASLLEAHLLDFTGDLYGEPARVRFVARLRGEERYDTVEALIEQIGRDCDDARRSLAG
ncbi:bifunctional riboflavin kinase/FAD synthetase [soil metagenome]